MKIGRNTCIENHCIHNKAIDLIYEKALNTSLPMHRSPSVYVIDYACENMQDRSVVMVTKPKSIIFENIYRKYHQKSIYLDRKMLNKTLQR